MPRTRKETCSACWNRCPSNRSAPGRSRAENCCTGCATGHYACVAAWTLILGLITLMPGSPVALAAVPPDATSVGVLDCSRSDRRREHPTVLRDPESGARSRYRPVRRIGEPSRPRPSRTRHAVRALLREKSPLYVRTGGASAEIIVPQKWLGRLAVGWGNSGPSVVADTVLHGRTMSRFRFMDCVPRRVLLGEARVHRTRRSSDRPRPPRPHGSRGSHVEVNVAQSNQATRKPGRAAPELPLGVRLIAPRARVDEDRDQNNDRGELRGKSQQQRPNRPAPCFTRHSVIGARGPRRS